MTDAHDSVTPRHRAQVRSLDDRRWVDGGLFVSVVAATRDAERMGARYGAQSRVVVEHE